MRRIGRRNQNAENRTPRPRQGAHSSVKNAARIRNLVDDVGPSTARSCGAVMSWMFKVALRHGAVTVNPVIGVSIPRNRTGKPQALDAVQYQDLRQKLIHWETAPALGRPRTQELHEISDFLIATGVRPGELFALRWNDVDLDAEPPTVFINATVIRTTAGGVRIQNHPKSQHGIRHLTIPDFLVEQLRERSKRQTESRTPNSLNLIFPSTTGTVCDANNVGKLWRKVADSIGYNWVTLKTFRKANATRIARTMGVEAAAGPRDAGGKDRLLPGGRRELQASRRPGVPASRPRRTRTSGFEKPR